MRKYIDRKIKIILKFRINTDAKTLNTKIATILAQRRINGADFFSIFREKMESLGLRDDIGITLRVFLCILKLDEYIIYIRMPSVSAMLNHFFHVKKNYDCPGFLYKKKVKRKYFNFIITPFILYEILYYKYKYENLERLSMRSIYLKSVSSLRGKGINIIKILSKWNILK